MTSSELVPTDAAGAIAERDKPANVRELLGDEVVDFLVEGDKVFNGARPRS